MSLKVRLLEANLDLAFICKCSKVLITTYISAFTKASLVISRHSNVIQQVAFLIDELDSFLLWLLLLLLGVTSSVDC